MKTFTLLAFASITFLASSCKKCYDCSKPGYDVSTFCNDRQTSKSALAIYESKGWTCVKQ